MPKENLPPSVVHFVRRVINNFRTLGPEAFWVFTGQIGTAVAGLFGVKVLTNALGPGEFGKLALANTAVALISTNILFGPLGQGLTRFWSISREQGNLSAFYLVSNRYGRHAVGLSILMTIILVAVVIPTKGLDWATLLAISMATGIASGWLGLRISVFTAARQRPRVALLDISSAFLRPIVAASFVWLIAVDAKWAMAGYLITTFWVILLAERFYYQTVHDISSSPLLTENTVSAIGKNIFSFSWPFALWGIFSWAHMSCDRWSLQTFYGVEVVGAFAVVSQLATFPLAFGSGFLSILFTPIAFQKAGDISNHQNLVSANKCLGAMTSFYILGAVILISFFSVFHYPLVLLISNTQFANFSFLLPWLTAAWGFFYLGQILCSFGMLINQTQSYILPKLISSVLAVIGTFYLSAKIGPSGVVWGLAAGGFVYGLWCAIIAKKLINNYLNNVRV
jgi:O-antigen/teichoic acid export membrane protein